MSAKKKVKRWRVYGSVRAGTYLGEYEAEAAEQAVALALDEAHVSVCHQCADQISDPQIDEDSLTAEEP